VFRSPRAGRPPCKMVIGVAMAMSEVGLPYVISPIIDARGRLLDGTPMAGGVARIDEVVTPRPTCYTVSCVHPSVLRQALRADEGLGLLAGHRLLGIKANASRKSPEELVELDEIESEDPERLADQVMGLQAEFGLRVLGGCCGTDHRYIEALADRLAAGRK
jgi:homocysteine S-methyltransferase